MSYPVYMMRKALLAVALMFPSLSVSFAQAPAFEALQGLVPQAPQGAFAGLDAQADKKWGVSYVLNGVLTIQEEKILLNTPDGRVFELDYSLRKARKFDGRTVHVEAEAKQADDMAVLKADKVEEFNPAAHDLKLPPYNPKRRQARLLGDEAGVLTVGNVRWHSAAPKPDQFDWATATIKPELVKKVYFIKKPFAPEWIAAHSLLVFTFEKGGLTDARGNEAAGLALTIEAFLRDGQVYDLKAGLRKNFGIVWMLTTWEDYAARTVLHGADDNRLIPYEVLKLSHAQKAALVRESVGLAAVNREGEYYHTITNNCTNNLLIAINRVLPENKRIRMWTIPYLAYNVRATMPVMVPSYLQGKGLLGPEMGVINGSNYQTPLD